MTPEVTCSKSADCLQKVEHSLVRLAVPRHTTNVDASLYTSLLAQLEFASREASFPFAAEAPAPLRQQLRVAWLSSNPLNVESHLCRRASQWQTNVTEALERLSRDWYLLVQMGFVAAHAALACVSPPLGDPHNHGRTVLKFTFDDGRAIVYKPRSVSAELAFAQVLDVLNGRGCQPTLSRCCVISRDIYGWAAFVAPTLVDDEGDIVTFYRRQGAFLTLFWLFGGSDAISDNIVVHGSHPLWIDTECMCAPELPYPPAISDALPIWIKDSVLSSAMLVTRHAQLVRLGRTTTGLSVSCTRARERVFSGEWLRRSYVDAVVDGFAALYTWLIDHRDILTSDGPVLSSWRNTVIKYVVRDTRYYVMLLSWWLSSSQGNYSKRRLLLSNVLSMDRPELSPLVESEVAALERADIPYFITSPYSTALREAGSERVQSIATTTGMDCIYRRIARMGETDLDRQSWLISSYLGQSR
jgi:lantibiotic modifying enzyme